MRCVKRKNAISCSTYRILSFDNFMTGVVFMNFTKQTILDTTCLDITNYNML